LRIHDFANTSADILALFASTCSSVGVECCTYAKRVRVNRRPSVKLLVENVGLKR